MMPGTRLDTLVSKLRQILPEESVLHDEERLRPYECDGLTAYRQLPMVVVLPDNAEQVREILRLCSHERIPVVARGAGTGLSGGALPLADGVLLSLAKFNRILEIDIENRTARVQPGVRNLAISEAVAHLGLYYAPDPSSQIACTIGGNVAENSGGLHCLKYGLTVHNIQQLEVLTMEGERITIGAPALDSPGFDLLALMTGSEGLLGVIAEVRVRLLPLPECARVLLAAFDEVEHAGAAVGEIISRGIIPGGLEMMDNAAIRAAEDFVHAGYPTSAAAILLCELDGTREEVDAQIERVRALLDACGATEVRVAQSEEERARFWAGRKAAFPAVGRISPDYYCMDGTIPRPRTPPRAPRNGSAVEAVRPARGQRVPRRRRQPPPPDPLRCQPARPARAGRGARRPNPQTVRGGRRNHHRRARGGWWRRSTRCVRSSAPRSSRASTK